MTSDELRPPPRQLCGNIIDECWHHYICGTGNVQLRVMVQMYLVDADILD